MAIAGDEGEIGVDAAGQIFLIDKWLLIHTNTPHPYMKALA